MKKWTNPEIQALELELTEQGTSHSLYVDDVRVDGEGIKWWSYSGEACE